MWKKTKIHNRICYSPAGIKNELDYKYTIQDEASIEHYLNDYHQLINADGEELYRNNKYLVHGYSNPISQPQFICQETIVKTTEEGVELPSGIYELYETNRTAYLADFQLRPDEELVKLKNLEMVLEEYHKFKTSRKTYIDSKSLYRRGILLYGPPGTGKSSSIHQILKQANLENTIVIWLKEPLTSSYLKELNKDDRIKIIIFEELTSVLRYHMSEMLDFLDGEKSLNNCFVIATTNYPEKLSSPFVKRPGRFDVLYKLGYLEKDEIKMYFAHFLPKEHVDLTLFSKQTTVAELKEIVLRVLRDKISIKTAIDHIKKHMRLADQEFNERGGIGFVQSEDD